MSQNGFNCDIKFVFITVLKHLSFSVNNVIPHSTIFSQSSVQGLRGWVYNPIIQSITETVAYLIKTRSYSSQATKEQTYWPIGSNIYNIISKLPVIPVKHRTVSTIMDFIPNKSRSANFSVGYVKETTHHA